MKLVLGLEGLRRALLYFPVQETIVSELVPISTGILILVALDAFEPLHTGAGGSIKFMPPLYMEDDKFIPIQDLPKPFYSSDIFTDNLLAFLSSKDDSNSAQGNDRPFFAYLPFTAPHCKPRAFLSKFHTI